MTYRNTTTRSGQLVNGGHIASTQDNMLGIDGNKGMLCIEDAFSGFKSANQMLDKTAYSTMDAIKDFKGEHNIERVYSYCSGDIERALRDFHIVPANSQLGAPRNNAVGTRCIGRGQYCTGQSRIGPLL